MEDRMYTGRLEALDIAFSFAVTTDVVNTVVLNHNCDPLSAHLLGRAMTAGLLCADTLGKNERLNLRWRYRGHLRTVLVDVGADGSSRGLISPTTLHGSTDNLEEIFGDRGEVGVIRSEEGRVLNTGTVDAAFHDVIEDLAYFYCTSDQVETAMCVMIGFNPDVTNPVSLCQGIKLQALPNADLERFETIRQRLQQQGPRDLLSHKGESGKHVSAILDSLLEGESEDPGIKIDEAPTPRFFCPCGPDKMGPVLRALPYGERMDMVKQGQPVRINCQFCNTQYTLSIDECIRAWNNQPLVDEAGS